MEKVTISKPIIKSFVRERKSRGFKTRFKALVAFENTKTRLDYARKHKKSFHVLETDYLDSMDGYQNLVPKFRFPWNH